MSQPIDPARFRERLERELLAPHQNPNEFELLAALATQIIAPSDAETRLKALVDKGCAEVALIWDVTWQEGPNSALSAELRSINGLVATMKLLPKDTEHFYVTVDGGPAGPFITSIGSLSVPDHPLRVSARLSPPSSWLDSTGSADTVSSGVTTGPIYQLAAGQGTSSVHRLRPFSSGEGAFIATLTDSDRWGRVIEMEVVTNANWQGLFVLEVPLSQQETVADWIHLSAHEEPLSDAASDIALELEIAKPHSGSAVLAFEKDTRLSEDTLLQIRPLKHHELRSLLWETLLGGNRYGVQESHVTLTNQGVQLLAARQEIERLLTPEAGRTTVFFAKMS